MTIRIALDTVTCSCCKNDIFIVKIYSSIFYSEKNPIMVKLPEIEKIK